MKIETLPGITNPEAFLYRLAEQAEHITGIVVAVLYEDGIVNTGWLEGVSTGDMAYMLKVLDIDLTKEIIEYKEV